MIRSFPSLQQVISIRSIDDVDHLLRSGADKVAINTAAVKNPKLISEVSKNLVLNVWLYQLKLVNKKMVIGRYIQIMEGKDHW